MAIANGSIVRPTPSTATGTQRTDAKRVQTGGGATWSGQVRRQRKTLNTQPLEIPVKPLPLEEFKPSESSHLMQLMTSSEKNDWATPQQWFDYLNLEFGFTLDPCAQESNRKCAKYFTPLEDGLIQSWAEERVFMNPPYGRELPKWMKKAYESARDHGALVVCFIPARVDTDWWHRYASKASEIRFPKGRVKFVGAESGAPFPVAIVIFRPKL